MRLLLDENISWRLADYLRPHCAAVLHVRDLGLDSSPDTNIWRYARQHGYDVLTKDEDFLRLVGAGRGLSAPRGSRTECSSAGCPARGVPVGPVAAAT